MVSLLIPEAASALGAKPGTEEYIQAAILLTFLMGLILVVASILRVGFLIENLLSHPVRPLTRRTRCPADILLWTNNPNPR
jgi:SulP family sulfate permease